MGWGVGDLEYSWAAVLRAEGSFETDLVPMYANKPAWKVHYAVNSLLFVGMGAVWGGQGERTFLKSSHLH